MGYDAFPRLGEAPDPSGVTMQSSSTHRSPFIRGVVLLLAVSMGFATFTYGGLGTAELGSLAMRIRDMGALALGDVAREIARVADAARADGFQVAVVPDVRDSSSAHRDVAEVTVSEVVHVDPAATTATRAPRLVPVRHDAIDPARARARTSTPASAAAPGAPAPAPAPAAPQQAHAASTATAAGGARGTPAPPPAEPPAPSADETPDPSEQEGKKEPADRQEPPVDEPGDDGATDNKPVPPPTTTEPEPEPVTVPIEADVVSAEPEAPGSSDSAPGHTGDLPGKAKDAPGHTGEQPGKSQDAPGHTGEKPGKSQDVSTPPGLKGNAGRSGHPSENRPGRGAGDHTDDVAIQQRNPRPEPRQGADTKPEPEPQPQPEPQPEPDPQPEPEPEG